jgi:hypothetical protein
MSGRYSSQQNADKRERAHIMATTASGIGLAWKYFGKLPGQTLTEFKAEWGELSDKSKAELTAGLSDGTESY